MGEDLPVSSGSQDGKVSFRRLCTSHLLIFVLLFTSHLLIFVIQCISHICNSYLSTSLLLIISFLYFLHCLPLFLSFCHLCAYLYLSFSHLSSCTTPYHIFLTFVFLCFTLPYYALFIFPYSSLYHFDHITERVLHGETDEVQLATKMKGKARMPSHERSKVHLCIQPQCQWQGCMDLFWS